jgi:FAD/FMN-containing dehydrogenase
MICSFDKMKDAIDTCTTVMQMGIPVARMEMMDENAVDAVNKYSNLDNPLRPSLIIEHHGSVAELEERSHIVQEVAKDFGAMDIEVATSAEDRKRLWSGRHSVWYAVLVRTKADKEVKDAKLTGFAVCALEPSPRQPWVLGRCSRAVLTTRRRRRCHAARLERLRSHRDSRRVSGTLD